MTDPGRIRSTVSLEISRGAARPGNRGRRDDDVGFGGVVGKHLLLLAQRLRRDLLGVAAGGLRIAGVDRNIDELGAEALDLLLDHGPRVVGLDDRAEATRGGDRLQPGHTGADDQHLGRR